VLHRSATLAPGVQSREITMLEFMDGSKTDALEAANDSGLKPGWLWMLKAINDDLWLTANDEDFGNPTLDTDD
jgi:hypothetical protein